MRTLGAKADSNHANRNWMLSGGVGAVSILLIVLAHTNPFMLTNEAYLESHTFFEILSVVICLSIYVVAGFRYEQTSEWQDLNLSMTFLAIGIIYFAHALSSPGFERFLTPNSLQKAAVFDSVARFVMVCGILFFVGVKPHFIRHRWPLGICTVGTFVWVTAVVLIATLYYQDLPNLYVFGANNTPSKFAIEAFIIGLSAIALALTCFGRVTGQARTALLLALTFSIFSSIFVYYRVSHLDAYNVFAHVYKFFVFVVLFWWLFVTAIRALYQANEQLSYANRALARSNRKKSEILANTSHELRTPLTAIMAFSELLSDRKTGKLNEVQADYLHEITDSAAALLRQINNLLNLSKVEAGKLILNLEPTNPGKLVQDTVKSMWALFQKQGLTIKVEQQYTGQLLHLDHDKIRQVLTNLLSNCAKFTPSGGTVTITVTSTRSDPAKLRIEVADTGVGIPEEHLKKVFHKFYQVDNMPCRLYHGSGLGLTVARHIVMAHGGTIEAQNSPGGGTTIVVELCMITDEMINEVS